MYMYTRRYIIYMNVCVFWSHFKSENYKGLQYTRLYDNIINGNTCVYFVKSFTVYSRLYMYCKYLLVRKKDGLACATVLQPADCHCHVTDGCLDTYTYYIYILYINI